jgi:hypothetical protein
MGRGLVLLAAALFVACAPVAPMLTGGRTTPRDRTDLALGAAVRVPVGDMVVQSALDDLDRTLALGAGGGAAPIGFVRYGLTEDLELGGEITPSQLRATLRGQLPLGSLGLLNLGIAPFGGYALEGDALAARGGALATLAVTLDISSIYEAWIGVRVGVEHAAGELGESSLALTGLRTGGAVGIGIGFRRFHVLIELAVDHELWWGSLDDSSIQRNGVVLTPAFAFRLRL